MPWPCTCAPLQGDPLLRHCLDFVALVACAASPHAASSPLTQRQQLPAPDAQGLLQAAASATIAIADASADAGTRAVAMRTLYVLLCSANGPLLSGARLSEAMRAAWRVLGASPAPPPPAVGREPAPGVREGVEAQVYAVAVLGLLLQGTEEGKARVDSGEAFLASKLGEIQAAVQAIARQPEEPDKVGCVAVPCTGPTVAVCCWQSVFPQACLACQ